MIFCKMGIHNWKPFKKIIEYSSKTSKGSVTIKYRKCSCGVTEKLVSDGYYKEWRRLGVL